MIEKTYSAFITEFSDALTRPALLDLSASTTDGKVEPTPKGRK
jgi:hypothetical protein